MICVVKQDQTGEITGWFTAVDMHDARRRAQAAFQPDLAAQFYRMEFTPTPGKHKLANGVTLLVD